jgi:hypothetical protein
MSVGFLPGLGLSVGRGRPKLKPQQIVERGFPMRAAQASHELNVPTPAYHVRRGGQRTETLLLFYLCAVQETGQPRVK